MVENLWYGYRPRVDQPRILELNMFELARKLNFTACVCAILVFPFIVHAADGPQFLKQPNLVKNPNLRAPLSAILSFTPSETVSTLVDISDGTSTRRYEFDASYDPKEGIPILGLRAAQRYDVRVSVKNASGKTTAFPSPLTVTTPPLPTSPFEFPPITIRKIDSQRMEPGVTIAAIRRRAPGRAIWQSATQREFARGWGMMVALDSQGQVVWYYQSDARIAGIDRFQDGNMLFHRADFRTFEINMLGEAVNQWYAGGNPRLTSKAGIPIDVQTLHHQPHELPSGNFLALTANARLVKNYVTNEYDPKAPRRDRMVMGDDIIEVRREDGAILWRWSAFDHLDPQRIGYGATDPYWITRGFPDHADWTHGNGVTHDERDNSVIVSLRHQDAILKIDRASGEIRWILGEPSDWGKLSDKVLKPVGAVTWPYHQHNPHISKAGTLVVFDNHTFGARPPRPFITPEKAMSRAVEFEIDEQRKTVRQVWSTETIEQKDPCNGYAMGDASRQPKTDNILVFYALCPSRLPGLSYDEYSGARHIDDQSYGGRIREYTRAENPETVFAVDIIDPQEILQWEVYGGLRVPSLYPPGREPKVQFLQ